QRSAFLAAGVGQIGAEVKAACPRLSRFVRVETVVTKFRVRQFPAGPVRLRQDLAPLRCGPFLAGAARPARLDPRPRLFRWTEIARYKFAELKRGEHVEFVRCGIERIPVRLEHAP